MITANCHVQLQRPSPCQVLFVALHVLLVLPLLASPGPGKTCPEEEFIHGDSCLRTCPQAFLNRTCVSECPPGTFSDKTSPHRECAGCLAGTFASQNDSRICEPCQEGHYQDKEQSVNCNECPEGTYPESPTGSKKCLPCNPGYSQSKKGSVNCEPCPVGQHQDKSGAIDCKKCETNMYQENEGSAQCEVCPDIKDDSKVPDQCKWKECPMGYTKKHDNEGRTECRICPKGTYQPDEDGTHCLPCPQGYYSNRRGSVRCIQCPENAWTPTSGMSSFFDCTGPSIQLFNDKNHQERFVIAYGSSQPLTVPLGFKMEFKYARVLSGKWRVNGGDLYGEGELIETEEVFRTEDLVTRINNEFCYFPLDLNKFSGKINRTRSGLYCASWDGLPDTDNYCVTDPNKQGQKRPGYEPWCLEPEHRTPVSCGIPVCGWDTVCKSTKKGHEYRGSLTRTDLGYDCRNWKADWPHPNGDYDNEADFGVGDHSFCRNPDPTYPTIFCYTTNWLKRFDNCDVPICSTQPRYIFRSGTNKSPSFL